MIMAWERVVPAVLLVGCVGSFAWGASRFFTRPAGVTPSMKLITGCSAVFGILHLLSILLSQGLTAGRSLAGSALYAGSAGLFWWAIKTSTARPLSAAFSPDAPIHLVHDGPYRLIRHPLYTSYILTWTAGWIVSGQWWLIPTLALMIAIYFVASSAEEEKFTHSPLAEAYRQYRSRTGRFLPNAVKLLAGPPAAVEARASERGA
jgi:protein-S-isoprenylcysteine O-methyltransferase Ste14